MDFEPEIVDIVTSVLFQNELVEIVNTKPATSNCVEAAGERATFEAMAKGLRGVPLDVEIKTALFKARDKDGQEIYIAFHIPANMMLAPQGVLKAVIKEKTGLEIIGKLDKDKALDELNACLAPVYEEMKARDQICLRDLEQSIEQMAAECEAELQRLAKIKEQIPASDEDQLAQHEADVYDAEWKAELLPRYRNIAEHLKAHIADPKMKHGELNPWTLFMMTNFSYSETFKERGAKEIKMLHIVDESLANRESQCTTNAGSKYYSITLTNAKAAFEFLQLCIENLGKEGNFFATANNIAVQGIRPEKGTGAVPGSPGGA